MKLWIVFFLAGQPAMTIGPLPYGIEECRERIGEHIREANEGIAKHPEIGHKPGDFTGECRFSETRPALKNPAPAPAPLAGWRTE